MPNKQGGIFYGWWVLVAGVVINCVILGARYSFGVFFKSLEGEFDLSRAATSGIFSVYMLLCGVIAVTGGWALDKYGPKRVLLVSGVFTGLSLLLSSQATAAWQLLLSYSLLLAIGTGAVYGIQVSTASRWFKKKRGLAVGIASSGGGIGMLVISPLVAYLIDSFDWRMAFFVTGIIAFVLPMSFALLMKKDPGDIGLQADGAPGSGEIQLKNTSPAQQGLTLREAIKTSQFWLIFFIWVFYASVMHIGTTHAVPHAIDLGIPAIQAALILTISGGAMIPATFLFGAVSDRIGRKGVLIVSSLLTTVAMVWLIFAQELWGFYLFGVILGITWGGLATTLSAMTSDIFGLKHIGVIMGFGVGAWAIGAAIGPYAAGFIFDVTQGYTSAFLYGAIIMVIATLFVVFTKMEVGKR